MYVTDKNVPLLISAMAFVVICLIIVGIATFVRGVQYRRRMLAKLRAPEEEWALDGSQDSDPTDSKAAGGVLIRLIGSIGKAFKPGICENSAETKLRFLKAGLCGGNVATVFWGTKFLLGVLFPVAFLMIVVSYFKTLQANHYLLGAIFVSLLGLILPDFWLRKKTAKRKDRLVKGFPDMLDLLVVCVEAGMGLDAAIRRVSEELGLSHGELSQELKLLSLELRAGKTRQSALRNLAARTDIEDVSSLVTLLIQTDRFGTSIAQALKIFSDSFRTARFQRAEEFAAKIATKLIFPLALFIFPSFFVVAIGPAAVQIYRVLLKG